MYTSFKRDPHRGFNNAKWFEHSFTAKAKLPNQHKRNANKKERRHKATEPLARSLKLGIVHMFSWTTNSLAFALPIETPFFDKSGSINVIVLHKNPRIDDRKEKPHRVVVLLW
jgi:hypothetical protein